MKRKPQIRKPTHRLVGDDGTVYAEIRCGDWRPAAKLIGTGETVRSESPSLDNDFLMGRWQNGFFYFFANRADHIPETAKMVRISDEEKSQKIA